MEKGENLIKIFFSVTIITILEIDYELKNLK